MISINTQIVENAILSYKKEIDDDYKLTLRQLERDYRSYFKEFSRDEKVFFRKFLYFTRDNNIITLKNLEIDYVKNLIGEIPESHFKKKIKDKVVYLKDLINNTLNYKKKRDSFYPKYFQKIGIKSCIYCNSQLTLTIEKTIHLKTKVNNIFIAKFQVDHFYPKDKYPYLSISLYNLYPTCASCNNAKKVTEVNFKLYQDNVLPSKYKFKLDIKSKAKFLTSRNVNDIEFNFLDPEKPDKKVVVKGSFEDTFQINGIYKTQKDVAEEIILKSQIYNKAYKKKLMNSFPHIFSNTNLGNRIILGNYCEREDIHKRPLAKFMQDIAEDAGLI
jgi:hypothetical protein